MRGKIQECKLGIGHRTQSCERFRANVVGETVRIASTLRPPEIEWKEYILRKVDEDRLRAFTEQPGLIKVAKSTSAVKKYVEAIT